MPEPTPEPPRYITLASEIARIHAESAPLLGDRENLIGAWTEVCRAVVAVLCPPGAVDVEAPIRISICDHKQRE